MSRRTLLSLLAYGLLLATLATPVYEPLETGRGDSWAIFILIGGVHLAVAAAIRRLWVMLLPVGFCIAAFIASGPTALSILIPVFLLPGVMVLTGLGWAAGTFARSRASLLASGLFLVASVPLVWATGGTVQHAHAKRVPASLRAQLPIEWSLSVLCPKSGFPAGAARGVRRQAEVLLREVRRHPDWVLSYSYPYADQPGEFTRDMTIHELGEQELQSIKDLDGATGKPCLPSYRRRLEAALG